MATKEKKEPLSMTNRKALFEYEVLEKLEVGIVLQGTEVKSLRASKVNFKDAYARFKDGEAWLYNLHISAYDHGSAWNHDPLRPRKLLLHKREIKRLTGKIEERGLTLIPIRLYFKAGRVKLELALARGKKLHDKRRDIADRDVRRDAERELKQRYRLNL